MGNHKYKKTDSLNFTVVFRVSCFEGDPICALHVNVKVPHPFRFYWFSNLSPYRLATQIYLMNRSVCTVHCILGAIAVFHVHWTMKFSILKFYGSHHYWTFFSYKIDSLPSVIFLIIFGWDCWDDLRLLKYDEPKVYFSLLPR